jgi:transglutaminase-like putative cysteine protease
VAQWWLLGGLALAILPHLFALTPWMSLTVVGAVLWRTLAQVGRLPLPGRWLLALLTVLVASAVVASTGVLLGRGTGTALLAVMTGLKLLETRRKRDAVLSTYLGFLLVATFFFSHEAPWVVLYLFASTAVLIAALVALNRDQGPVTPLEVMRPAALLILQALPLMALMFLLVPRLPGPLWGRDAQGTAVTGLAETMAPGSISQLLLSEALAFRVRFEGDTPAQERLYWRGPVFWEYAEGVWQPGAARNLPPPLLSAEGPAINYSVLLEAQRGRWLPALDLPVPGATQGSRRGAAGELLALRPVVERRSYQARSLPNATLQHLLPPAIRRAALQLVPDEAPRLRALAERWRGLGLGDQAILDTALGLINQQSFRYTLEPPVLSGDPADSFFFDTRAGFCEHFASAFTVLMRAASIPARIVTGYLGAHRNPLAGYWMVYQADAHAWSEVWIAGRGWVRVDPTAAVAPNRVDSGLRTVLDSNRSGSRLGAAQNTWLFGLAMGWDVLEERWNRWVLGYDQATQRRLWFEMREAANWLIPLIAGALGIPVLMALWNRRRARRLGPIDRAYQRFCNRLARVGLSRQTHEGPRAYTARVVRQRPDLSAPVQRISAVYEQLTYGSPTNPSPGLVQELARLVGKFRPRGY